MILIPHVWTRHVGTIGSLKGGHQVAIDIDIDIAIAIEVIAIAIAIEGEKH